MRSSPERSFARNSGLGDTFVDFDTGLNSAVKKLREALGDSAEEPRYIETLPRRGYRFVAHVEIGFSAPVSAAPVPTRPVSNAQPTAMDSPLSAAFGRRSKWRVLISVGAVALILVAALVAWRVYFARPALTNTDVILVTNFVNKTGEPIFDGARQSARSETCRVTFPERISGGRRSHGHADDAARSQRASDARAGN